MNYMLEIEAEDVKVARRPLDLGVLETISDNTFYYIDFPFKVFKLFKFTLFKDLVQFLVKFTFCLIKKQFILILTIFLNAYKIFRVYCWNPTIAEINCTDYFYVTVLCVHINYDFFTYFFL